MERKTNLIKRIFGIFLNPTTTLKEVCEAPTSWKLSYLLLVAIITILFVFLVQMPSGLTSILIGASIFPQYLIFLLFFVVMALFSLIFVGILNLIYVTGVRLKRSRIEHRSRKTMVNLYIYSLVPFLLLSSQIPFILIFGGHYSLFQLQFFFYFLLGVVFGWHFTLVYRGLQTCSDISPKGAKIVTGIYMGIIIGFAFSIIYAILYINFDISWLGFLM
ncbi:MAG: YIP1 family protein [Candidatus Helarchaeota archaeon]|nr:YIP1 family protein [Candidatus Helarchaeota archaeon]